MGKDKKKWKDDKTKSNQKAKLVPKKTSKPPPPPPGQGRPTKPSHDRQAKGGGGHPRSTTSQRAESSISECKFFSSKLLSKYSSV